MSILKDSVSVDKIVKYNAKHSKEDQIKSFRGNIIALYKGIGGHERLDAPTETAIELLDDMFKNPTKYMKEKYTKGFR